MRIDLHYGAQEAAQTDRKALETSRSERGVNSRAELGQDQTVFTSARVQVQALVAQALQLPEVREQKVQALRQTLQAGQYQVKPQEVADAMVALMASGSLA